jgi:hypothetical protein
MITPQDIEDKKYTKTLSEEEKFVLLELETNIDRDIEHYYAYGTSLVPDPRDERQRYPKFNGLPNYRREIVLEVMFSEYRKSWKIEFVQGTDDGPNRPGTDHWKFTKK